jgi:8-oxo-dGTP diphosphatase
MTQSKTTVRATTPQSAASSFERPFTTVDVVIFTVRAESLQVLLVKRSTGASEPFPGLWALPGGFVNVEQDDSLEQTARRKLVEKTGVKSPYLEQLGSWGGKRRDPRGWTASHVYFALIPSENIVLTAGGNAADAMWHPVAEAIRKRLAFDHAEILKAAVDRLLSKVEYTSLPAFLIQEPFTIPQLQRIYEVVLGRPIDKGGFRTRALAADFLAEVGMADVGARRPAMTYRLRDRKHPIVFPRTFYPPRQS